MKLVLIPAGEFLMGSPDSDNDARANEKPRHRVRITRWFYLGATPVTQGQYQAVTNANPSLLNRLNDVRLFLNIANEPPVGGVSWEDAQAFCARLNEREKGQLSGMSYRLPTEAEWEYACRAGSQTRFASGDADASLRDHAWFSANSFGAKHPVGQKPANAWGLYDMHGNVWEWCSDAYAENYYAQSPVDDPRGPDPAETADRVFRGGSWVSDPHVCRAASRGWAAPGFRNDYLGFRVAWVRSGR
jgi:formylglycine-generating enzyme required for sulfatase activity